MKKYTILLIIIFNYSCRNQDKTTVDNSNKDSINSVNNISVTKPYIINESFVNNSINLYSIYYLRSNFSDILKLKKEPTVNDHDATLVDTIYKFYNSKNEIKIYKTIDKEMIIGFKVTDSRFPLIQGIKTGIKLDEAIKNLNIKERLNDSFDIGDAEGWQYFTFYFSNKNLKEIEFHTMLD